MQSVKDQVGSTRRSYLVFQGNELYNCSSTWGTISLSTKCNNLVDPSFSVIDFLADLRPSTKILSNKLIKTDLNSIQPNLKMITSVLGNPHFTYRDASGSQFIFYFGVHPCGKNTEIGYCILEFDILNNIKSVTKYIVPCCETEKKKLDEQLSNSYF